MATIGSHELRNGDLPLYFFEPGDVAHRAQVPVRGFRHRWRVGRAGSNLIAGWGPAAAETTCVPRSFELSAGFSLAIALPGANLPATVCQWWTANARAGTVTVHRRLRLGPPSGRSGGVWSMRGRLSRALRWRGVPVIVELSPLYGPWTRMNLTPQSRVFTSRRYFRIGHAVLDQLSAALIETSLRSSASAGR